MDDFRKIIYGTLIAFLATIVVWVGFLTISGCGFTVSCLGAQPKVERTSIPTLIPATLPAPARFVQAPPVAQTQSVSTGGIARPSNPGGVGQAVNLNGNADLGRQIFAANCAACHAAEGKGGNPNPGSDDGTIPALNPIDSTLINADYKIYATNLDLFIEHGSTPAGPSPTFQMPAWGDKSALQPQQIADVIAYLISLNPAPVSTSSVPTAAGMQQMTGAGPNVEDMRPSNPGGPGTAITLTGNVDAGQQIFAANCAACHAAEGKGGVANPGSADGTVPALNPIHTALVDMDYKTFATNLDLFIEHGSTPKGVNPTFQMPAWGDKGALQPQQIADVIAYIISLNK